jgi:hypothetical protein
MPYLKFQQYSKLKDKSTLVGRVRGSSGPCWQQLGPTCITSSASSPSAAAALPLRLFSTSGAGETDRGRIASSRQSRCRLSHRHFPANSITASPQLPLRFSDHRLSLVQRETIVLKICTHALLRELRIDTQYDTRSIEAIMLVLETCYLKAHHAI